MKSHVMDRIVIPMSIPWIFKSGYDISISVSVSVTGHRRILLRKPASFQDSGGSFSFEDFMIDLYKVSVIHPTLGALEIPPFSNELIELHPKSFEFLT